MRRTSSLFAGPPGDDRAACPEGSAPNALSLHVEPQTRLAHAIVGTVALEAAVRQDRLDVEVEVDAIRHARQTRTGLAGADDEEERGRREDNHAAGEDGAETESLKSG